MSRAAKLILFCTCSIALGGLASACGTEKVKLASSDPNYQGALLFNQRCSGCHTLSQAATHGSAAKVQTAQYNNGPNFDVRCERPVTRVLYAIQNGGFSGAIMPQNIVVGQQATEVAKFVATYAGTKAPKVPGVPSCQQKSVGSIPAPAPSTTATTTATTPTTTATTKSGGKAPATKKAGKKRKP
jgi:mono/diheme cytochrome c family protein